jgi:hypothetical protein
VGPDTDTNCMRASFVRSEYSADTQYFSAGTVCKRGGVLAGGKPVVRRPRFGTISRCTCGAKPNRSKNGACCPPPPPHRWEPISKIEDPSDELVGAATATSEASDGKERASRPLRASRSVGGPPIRAPHRAVPRGAPNEWPVMMSAIRCPMREAIRCPRLTSEAREARALRQAT